MIKKYHFKILLICCVGFVGYLLFAKKFLAGALAVSLLLAMAVSAGYANKKEYINASFSEKYRWYEVQKNLNKVRVGSSSKVLLRNVGLPDKTTLLGVLDGKKVVAYSYFLTRSSEKFYKKVYFHDDIYKAAIDSSQKAFTTYPFSRVVWMDHDVRYSMCDDLTKNHIKLGDSIDKIRMMLGIADSGFCNNVQCNLRYVVYSRYGDSREGIFDIDSEKYLEIRANPKGQITSSYCIGSAALE